MVTIMILVAFLIIGIILLRLSNDEFLSRHEWASCITFMSSFLLFVVFLSLFISHKVHKVQMERIKTFNESLFEAREKNSTNLENTAILHDIIGWNQWITASQYHNENTFDLWVPDEIMELNQIR